MHLDLMNVLYVHSNHRDVKATHVAIFMVIKTEHANNNNVSKSLHS
jgi:hypothetical protein